MSTSASVLRIGPAGNENPSASLLQDALLSYFDESSTAAHGPNAEQSGTSHLLTVSNKYFTALVFLDNLTPHPPANAEQRKEDGIVLVFDSNQSTSTASGSLIATTTSFDGLTSVHDAAEKSGQCGDLLRLCVGVTVGPPTQPRGGKEYEEEYSRRVLWCLDRGYEYVEADLSEEGQRSGHDERDKDGFARVVEAIGGTVWSSAVMGSKRGEQLKRLYQRDSAQAAARGPGEASASSSSSEGGKKSDPPSGDGVSKDKQRTPAGNVKGENGGGSRNVTEGENSVVEEVAKEPISDGEADKTNNGTGMEEKRNQTRHEEEKLLEDLERVMGEASRIREAARSGNMSDEDRRKRAGDAALMMMGLLDKLDMGDGDDGPEQNGDDSSEDEEVGS